MKLLSSSGSLVLRGGALVLVDETHAAGFDICGKPCDCSTPCTSCNGTQTDATSVANNTTSGTCGTGLPCDYATTTLGWDVFTSSANLCTWTWFTPTHTGPDPHEISLTVVYNPTGTTQSWTGACSTSIPPGQWYIVVNLTNYPFTGTRIQWSKLNASVTCSGGQLHFAETLTQCFNNWVGCVCGNVTVSK